jgi:RNA polymerase sigma factor (sigma-70 family)
MSTRLRRERLGQDKRLARNHAEYTYDAWEARSAIKITDYDSDHRDELLVAARLGSKRALSKLLLLYLPFIKSRARLKLRRIEFDDAMQAGVLGFMRAVRKYNPEVGAFTTCAGRWIDNEIQDAVVDSEVFGAGRDSHGEVKLRNIARELIAQGKSPTFEAVCNECVAQRLALPSFATVQRAVHKLISGREVLEESLWMTDETPETLYLEAEQAHAIRQALDALTPIQWDAVTQRYELYGREEEGYAPVGARYGVSPQRIGHVVTAALGRMRRELRKVA